MRLSQSVFKTLRADPKDEEAANARLLTKAGFVSKLMAGVYSFLPLGLRVMRNIEGVIRKEMNALHAEEVSLPVLHPKENWEVTGRWKTLDVLYKLKARDGKELALGPTHEEVIVPLAGQFVNSYKDLPFYLYQIQTKFRDEARAKSGLLRGREFLMKDLYSFHADEEGLDSFYEKIKESYHRIFKRLDLKARLVEASGGTFAKYSHEFQVFSEAGEDTIYHCSCGFAQNSEIFDERQKDCPKCGSKIQLEKSIEVGNIFKLKTKYSKPFDLKYKDRDGKEALVHMGCYGIGLGRLLAAVVETHHDEKGIVWPEAVAPFRAHLIALGTEKYAETLAEETYRTLAETGLTVLYDDRKEASAGEKFADADLIGIPWRLIVSEKTADKNKIEIKKRNETKTTLVPLTQVINLMKPDSLNPKR